MRHINNISAVARLMCCWLMAAALHGCSIRPAETNSVHTYLLDPNVPAKTVSTNDVRNDQTVLLISIPKARPGFETTRMAYLLRQHELSYYAFNQWVDTPGRMMLRLVAQAMEATGLWRAVVQAPALTRADYRLDCDNLVLEQQFFSPSRVRLGLRAQLIDIKRQTVIGTRHIEIFEDSASEDAYGGVLAANKASAKLLDELSHWVKAVMHEDRADGP